MMKWIASWTKTDKPVKYTLYQENSTIKFLTGLAFLWAPFYPYHLIIKDKFALYVRSKIELIPF